MSVDPPGPPTPDAAVPPPAGDPTAPASKAKVKAGRAAGPKRTPRPTPSAEGPSPKRRADRRPAAAGAAVGAAAASAAPGSTTVADRPAGAPAPPTDPTTVTPGGFPPASFTPPPGAPVPPAQPAPAVPSAAPAPAPTRRPAPKRRATRRGRRVKRVVRRIDLWSVLKLSLVVYTCLYLVTMASLAVLWGLAYETDTIEKVTSFLADVGMENFHFYGDRMFRAAAAIGAVLVMAGTIITVLATALVNVISELTGGIRLVVIEEDPQA